MSGLDTIFACKMYRSSSRKDKINSALKDPMNKELVMQLTSYLDDEYKQETLDAKEPEVKEETSKKPSDIIKHHKSSGSAPHFSSSPSLNLDDSLEDLKDEEESSEDASNQAGAEAVADEVTEETSESTEDEEVESSTDINDVDILSEDSIKENLNLSDECKGVSRVAIKNNELWIYYSDSVNLNSVMDSVISKLESENRNLLQFSRLARSENAMVFDIDYAK